MKPAGPVERGLALTGLACIGIGAIVSELRNRGDEPADEMVTIEL